MENEKKKMDWGRVIITTILALSTAVVFLSLGYWAGTMQGEENAATEEETSATAVISSTATTSASTTASTVSTADWKTYTNSEYGFSFKYPKDWIIEEGASTNDPRRIASVKSNEPNKNKVWPGETTIYYYDQMIINKETESTVSDWIKARLAGGYTDNSKIVTINGAEYTEIVPGSDPEYLAELKVNNGTLFSIIFDWAGGRSEITKTQEQILSTFQFTSK